MDLNFNKRYAYAEVYSILNWLGDEYKRKVPKNLLQLFKLERKFGYDPELDFNKPLIDQVRQETKDIIAYLQYSCWLENDQKKAELKAQVEENARRVKEEKRILRNQRNELRRQRGGDIPLNQAIDNAISRLNGNG
ncbi:MAG: hypothetical protein IKI57_04675 [Clostridia bacterium]|nr:hypothetical protein [Clostridia bacterium]